MHDISQTLGQQPQFVFVIILVAIVFGSMALTMLGVVGMLIWRSHQAKKMSHNLKLEMVSSGMSADEIERVLAARTSGG